jgi:ubiquinone/menaquinone biosynthesis C-methylase UbiE
VRLLAIPGVLVQESNAILRDERSSPVTTPDSAQEMDRQKEAVRQQWAGRAATFAAMAGKQPMTLQAATDLLLTVLRLRPAMRILDVASGPGEPAISIAAAVAPEGGHVTATDLVPEMLATAERNARARGVTDIAFRLADAEALPFADAAFDAVTCRFGVMLFPNTQQALGEIRRVLKPGGQFVAMVWGPQAQDALFNSLAVVRRSVTLPPPADTPHRFRFSEPGALGTQLRAAGFRQVEDAVHTIPMPWQGSAEEWWEAMQMMNGAMKAAVEALDADRRAALVQEVLDAKRAAQREGRETSAVIVASAVR